jgi:hypothetical protein
MKTVLRQAATPQHRSRPRVNDRPYPTTRPSGQHPRRRFLRLAVGAAAFPAASRIARAQAYPTRPITIVVPYPPGGATDVIARNLAERMKVSFGQPVIIENVTGAGGTIATRRAVRAAPDGYTLSIGQNDSHAVTGATYARQAKNRDLEAPEGGATAPSHGKARRGRTDPRPPGRTRRTQGGARAKNENGAAGAATALSCSCLQHPGDANGTAVSCQFATRYLRSDSLNS